MAQKLELKRKIGEVAPVVKRPEEATRIGEVVLATRRPGEAGRTGELALAKGDLGEGEEMKEPTPAVALLSSWSDCW